MSGDLGQVDLIASSYVGTSYLATLCARALKGKLPKVPSVPFKCIILLECTRLDLSSSMVTSRSGSCPKKNNKARVALHYTIGELTRSG